MQRLLRHTLAYLPAQLFGPLLQLAVAVALTHALGAADYGLTLMVFAGQELVFLVCLSWWTTFYLRYGSRWAGASPGSELAILGLSSLAQGAVTVALLLLTDPSLPLAVHLAACAFTVSRSAVGFLGERARQQASIGAYTVLQIAAPLGGLAACLALAAAGPLTPVRVLGGFALAQTLVAGAVAARLGLAVRPAWPGQPLLRAALAFGAPVVLSNLLSWLGGNGVRFVVQHGAGAVALGWLSVGWGLATRLAGVAAMMVSAAAYPLAVRAMEAGDSAGARRQLADNAALLLAVLAPAVAGMAVLGEAFTRWLVAPDYHATTVAILPWALLGAGLRNWRLHGLDPLYLLCEAPREMVVLDAVEATVTALAAALGLWWGGVVGAVVGTAVAAAAVAAGDALYLRRRFGLQLALGRQARIVAAALGMAGLLALADAAWPAAEPGAARLALGAAIGALAYALLLVLLMPAERRALAAWWGRRKAVALQP